MMFETLPCYWYGFGPVELLAGRVRVPRFFAGQARWALSPLHRQLFFCNLLSTSFFSFAENNIFLSCGYYVDSCLCEDVTKIETILDPYTQLYAMLGEMSHASGSDSRRNCRARFTVLARSGKGSEVDLCPTLAAFKQGGGPDRSHLARH